MQSQSGTCAALLVDYPGYGDSNGVPGPASILRSSLGALRALEKHPRFRNRASTIGLVGHSLGAAASLELAVELMGGRTSSSPPPGEEIWLDGGGGVDRIVLVSPFTTMVKMARLVAGPVPPWLLGKMLTSPWDNLSRLRELDAAAAAAAADGKGEEGGDLEQGARRITISILHGTHDEVRGTAHNEMCGVLHSRTHIPPPTHTHAYTTRRYSTHAPTLRHMRAPRPRTTRILHLQLTHAHYICLSLSISVYLSISLPPSSLPVLCEPMHRLSPWTWAKRCTMSRSASARPT